MEPSYLQFTQAKARLSSVFDLLEQGRGLRVICRHKSSPIALTDGEDLKELLADTHRFTTTMTRAKDGTVSIWLNELDIYGRGASIPEAVDDLMDEIGDYADEWESDLHAAPNHAERSWWVRRVQLAADRAELRQMVFPVPERPAAQPTRVSA